MSTYLPSLFGENLMDVFDDFDREFFQGMNHPERVLYGKHAPHMMKTDVKETDDHYEVIVDLPGFSKDEISLELNNGNLTIATQKRLTKENQGKMLRQERYMGTMQRTFYVGDSLTEEDIKAKYENGVLTLLIPKKEARKVPEKKQICIEG